MAQAVADGQSVHSQVEPPGMPGMRRVVIQGNHTGGSRTLIYPLEVESGISPTQPIWGSGEPDPVEVPSTPTPGGHDDVPDRRESDGAEEAIAPGTLTPRASEAEAAAPALDDEGSHGPARTCCDSDFSGHESAVHSEEPEVLRHELEYDIDED
eukprot:11947225-Alexandrium_andersonii.AAC.1